jgi:UDP-N-acetyl-D-mannosaminuronic acid dehydrogenase
MIVEPNISVHDFFDLTNLKQAIKLCDIIVILVKHDEFKSLVLNENQLLIDFCGV